MKRKSYDYVGMDELMRQSRKRRRMAEIAEKVLEFLLFAALTVIIIAVLWAVVLALTPPHDAIAAEFTAEAAEAPETAASVTDGEIPADAPETAGTAAEAPTERETEPPTEQEPEASAAPEPKYLGKFTLTAYCSCEKCCGRWAGGPTKSGTMPEAGRTVAVDTSVIPLGTHIIIDGHEYVAEDTGSAVRGKHIDIYFDSHDAALNFGKCRADVYIVKE